MVIVALRLLFIFLLRLIDRALLLRDPDSDFLCLHGREPDPLKREVYAPGYAWGVFTDRKTGDSDILPIGEEGHEYGKGCPCSPRVDVEGARLVIIHNAYDHREIIEEALAVMNGVE